MTPDIQALGAKAGGLAVRNRTPPNRCPRCRASFEGRSWHSWLGHKGLHSYADKYHSGDISRAARRLAMNSVAKYDPAAWNGAFKYKPAQLFKTRINTMKTDFSAIRFNAEEHRYFYGDQELTSVTKMVKTIQKPFDKQGVAAKTAAKEGKSVQQVLAEWEAKGEKGRALGTLVHDHIQRTLLNLPDNQTSFDAFLSLNTLAPEITAFNRLWSELETKVGYGPSHIEFIVGDSDLGLAGTVDSMFCSNDTGQWHIWDWKTGKFELSNRWQKLLPPFDYLDDCQFNVYSLQVSLYRLIIESNTGFDLGDSYLVHLGPEGHQIHRAIDLRAKILDWVLTVPF